MLIFYMFFFHAKLEIPENLKTAAAGPFKNVTHLKRQLDFLNLSGNQLTGQINPIFCTQIDNWAIEGFSSSKSYLFDNKFCPPYPICDEVQITSEEYQDCNP